MFNSISLYKERRIKECIQRPFKYPLPPSSNRYPHDKPALFLSLPAFLHALLTEFPTLFTVRLHFNAPNIFSNLRQFWNIDESSYKQSFSQPLTTLSGPLGFSGATFFTTADKKYLIKSLDRTFEWRYYYNHLLQPLATYYLSNPDSFIVHITNVLYNFAPRIGRILKTCPSNFLVMVNSTSNEWEDYDLKPTAYFYPERDFLGGRLTSQKTKEKLHDEFPGEITLTREIYDRVLRQLDKDTAFLCDMKVVDYSCFVVQRRVGRISSDGTGTTETSGWIIDALGEWEYRFTILDFFTSAKMIRIKAMKVGIDMLGHGDMTITASVHGIQVELIQPERYREDWMAMVKENLRIVDTRENRKCHWNNNRLDG